MSRIEMKLGKVRVSQDKVIKVKLNRIDHGKSNLKSY